MCERLRSTMVALVEKRTKDTPGIKTGVESPEPTSLLLAEWVIEVTGKLLGEFNPAHGTPSDHDLPVSLCVEIICIACDLIWLQRTCWDPNGVVSPEDVVRELEAAGIIPVGILESQSPQMSRRRPRRRAAK